MHTGLRITLIFILGLLVGVAAAVPVSFYLLVGTSQGQEMIRSYVASSQQWPDLSSVLQKSGGSLTEEQTQRFLTTPVTVGVPIAYGTQGYANALNMFLGHIQALGTSTNALAQILVQINNQALSNNFNGFFDLVVKAKGLVAGQKVLASQLSQDIAALGSANQGITDAVTKSQTQNLLVAAKSIPQDLNTYLVTIDQILSGAPPSAELIVDMTAKAKILSDNLTATGIAMNTVLERFKSTSQTQGQ